MTWCSSSRPLPRLFRPRIKRLGGGHEIAERGYSHEATRPGLPASADMADGFGAVCMSLRRGRRGLYSREGGRTGQRNRGHRSLLGIAPGHLKWLGASSSDPVLDQFPSSGTIDYLRSAMVTVGALPERDDRLEAGRFPASSSTHTAPSYADVSMTPRFRLTSVRAGALVLLYGNQLSRTAQLTADHVDAFTASSTGIATPSWEMAAGQSHIAGPARALASPCPDGEAAPRVPIVASSGGRPAGRR
jgi:hypothetical protein